MGFRAVFQMLLAELFLLLPPLRGARTNLFRRSKQFLLIPARDAARRTSRDKPASQPLRGRTPRPRRSGRGSDRQCMRVFLSFRLQRTFERIGPKIPQGFEPSTEYRPAL